MKVAMLLGDGFEDHEFREPFEALRKAGHDIDILGVAAGETLEGKRGIERIETQAAAAAVDPDDYDGLVIPGGWGPDRIRTDPGVIALARGVCERGRLVAAICHGPQVLIDADLVRGRRLTSYPSIETDLRNAGAEWVNEEVVRDGNLITARQPSDLPAFDIAILSRLEELCQKGAIA